jgi:hypothetical protein
VYTPLSKVKIVFVFYQLATQVPRVYDILMPYHVNAFLESTSVVVSLGLTSIETTPLECVGLAGYRPRLIFWIVVPIVLTLVVVGIVLSSSAWRFLSNKPDATDLASSGSDMHFESQRTPNALVKTLQPTLVLMFVLYPKVCACVAHAARGQL